MNVIINNEYLFFRSITNAAEREAGLVKQAHEWVYSSASNYQKLESILEVERISQRLIPN